MHAQTIATLHKVTKVLGGGGMWSLGTLKSDYIMYGPPLTLIIMERFFMTSQIFGLHASAF